MAKKTTPEENGVNIPTKPVIHILDTDAFRNRKNTRSGLEYWNKFKAALFNYIFDNPSKKDNFIRVRFTNTSGAAAYVLMTAAEVLFHVIVWRLNVVFQPELSKHGVRLISNQDFYDLSKYGKKTVETILNSVVERMFEVSDDVDAISFHTSYVIDDLAEIAECFAFVECNTISIWDILQLMKRSKSFSECVNTELSETASVKELENQIEIGREKVVSSVLEDKKSGLYPYIRSERISRDQMTQTFFAVGPRTDVDNTVIPGIIRGNFLKGFRNISEWYIECIQGRIAQIAKCVSVRDSGYLSRQINLGTMNVVLDNHVKDCGTKETLRFEVKDEDWLNVIHGKFMVQDDGRLHKVDRRRDKHLIGQTIRLRSQLMCKLPTDHVCQTCYGSKAGRVIGTRIGGLPAIKIINKISKLILRLKHFTSVHTSDDTSSIMDRFFVIENSKVFLHPEYKSAKDMFITIDRDYIEDLTEVKGGESDDDMDTTSMIDEITIIHAGEEYTIELDKMFLSITEELLAESDNFITDGDAERILIPVSKIDTDIPLFDEILITEAATIHLKAIMKVINSSQTSTYRSPEELMNAVLETLFTAGIKNSIFEHSETMIYKLLRKAGRTYERFEPGSGNENLEILSLNRSIMESDLTTSYSFQGLKNQQKNINTYRKNDAGIYEDLFYTRRPPHVKRVDSRLISSMMK